MLRILKIAFRSLKNIYYDAFKCIFVVVITSFNMKFDHNSLIIVTTIRTSKSLLLFDDFDEHGLKLKFRNFLISLLFRSILGCSGIDPNWLLYSWENGSESFRLDLFVIYPSSQCLVIKDILSLLKVS